jgi:septal ring factor EnvC (AmiA/AmiB activator)
MVNFLQNKHRRFSYARAFAVLALIAFAFVLSGLPQAASASRASDLQSDIEQMEDQIAANRAKIARLDEHADSLAQAVADFDGLIATTNQEIALIELKLTDIRLKLEETRAELERQKEILRQSLREHYTFGEVRTIELLAESDSFADFFNQKEYLDRVRTTVQESAKRIAELERQLAEQEAEQQRLLTEQQAKKAELEAQRAAKQRLLDETRGQEALYRARLAGLEREHSAAEAELNLYIANLVGSGVSLGPVREGEVIGGVGNTGYSTGPHLHFAIQHNGCFRNPLTVMSQKDWAWPVPGYGATQGFSGDASDCNDTGHEAIDIGTQGRYGVPVVSTADGDIIHRGCLGEGRYRNYAVLIKHPGGYVSRYIHMNPPADSAYDSCRANTYY